MGKQGKPTKKQKMTNQKKRIETKQVEKETEEFFKRRFPDKNIEFEKKCGYFQTWENRIKSGNPEESMDEESKRIWNEMRK